MDKNTITISKSITVNGKGHTIDVNGGSIRIFTVSANNVVLENIIFRNGVSSFGGAISFNNIAKVINCTFINNSARYGGAINIGSGVEVNIIGSNFTSNVASLGGGAVYSWGGSVNVINSTFNYCVSVYGGAILSLEGNLIVNSTKFNNNQAFDFGGGIYKQSTKLTINQGYFHNNSAYYDGGGVYISHGTTNIKNTLFTSNIAGYGGGAIHSLAGTFKLNDSIFADNTSYTNNGWIDTPYLNSFIDFGNYTLVVANTSNYNGTLPSYFSLRDNGWDTKVKNQGSLGICWDYAVIATVETAIKKATGVEVDLSESNLKNLISKYSIYGNNRNPNNGAYQWEASSYLACSLGPVLESLDPTGSFGFSPLLDNAYHISNIALASRSHYSFLDNNKIKEAVIKYGAVRASIKMDTHKGYNYYTKDTDTNHAVAIVGWDDNYAASNFPDGCPGNGAWIVKNSWGASSGKKGYIYVSYYDKSFAWDTLSYIIFNDTIKYDRVYQYDYRNYNWRYTSSSIWYKNTYTSVKNEFITAFSTYFYGKNNWEVQIYVNDELKHTQKGSSIGSGYFTFNLDKIIPVAKGEKFTIVFKVEKGGLPYVKKNLITKSCGAGVSYYSKDGVNWYDLNNDNQVACLKVFTTICNLPGSLVSVNPITNVTYNSQVIVNFNVENRTAVNYYVSKNGQVVCSENNITNNQIKLSNLDVGEYTITIKNQHGTKYMGDVKSVKFTINKASSSIYIDDIDDVVYGNVVNVKFNFLNSTNLSYVVKNKKNNNIVISKKYISNLSNFSIDVLDVGEYIVTIYNDESIHYFKSESSAQFRIIKPTPEISITTTNIIYPGKVSVGVKSNVIGTYAVSVGDKSKTVVLIANKQSNIVFDSLAAGKHTISVKYMQTSNYNSITVNSSVVVLKAQTNVNIKSINTITYPNKASIDFTISNPTTVTYMVKTSDGDVVVENTSLKNINNIILPVLDAGDYIITIANGGSENYSGNSSSAQFTITKATPCVTILTNNLTYSNKIIVSINTTASGSYNVQVGEKIKTVKLTANKINNVEFEGLTVNTYNVLVSCSESNNYKSTSKKGILTISKAKSTINLSPINISYPNDNVICFSINNKTKLSYLIKNSTGIVFNNTNLTTNNITIPVLIPGDYIITIFSEESENYTGVVKNVEFSVEKPDSYIESENINVEYDGNPVIVNISSDYANNISYHLYDFNNCEVLNGTVGVGENIVLTNLNVGYYLINLTTIPDNVHKAVSKQYNINITKSTPMLSISSDNITYTGDLTVCINTTVTGSYMVKVGNQTKNITLNAYEINNIVFYGLSAGDYDVIVYCPQTVNYMSASNNCTVKVFKANFNVDITSVTYPGSVDVNFDNIITTNITYYVKTLSGDLVVSDTNLTNINNFTLPVLAAGEYIITIITEENENYTGEVKSFNFEVEKALSQINSSNITVAYDGNPVLVNVSSENATNITYHVYDHNSKEVLNGTVSVGENIALNNLSAGQYIINLTSGVDGNHSQTSKQYTINITKGNIDLKIQCNNITHNTQILVKIYVNIEGNYTINIDNTYNKTYELKIGENIINDIPLLNIGNYTLNVTGNIKNYESTSKSIKFNIYPKTNPTTNNPTKTKQSINNIKTQFKLLNSKKYTFKKSKNTKKIKVTLQAKNGNILSKVKIIFKFNEKDLKNIKAKNKKGKKLIKQLKKGHAVKSNSKGVATLKLKNKHLTFNKGKYIFNVSFNGQGIYDKSNQNGKITIK